MSNLNLFHQVCAQTSELITKEYSTSFSRATELYPPEIRTHIYNIYGFVRFADEIVDTFHDYPKEYLLNKFIDDYHDALKQGISLNPILHAFTSTQKKFNIQQHLVDAFLHSMRMDLGDMSQLTEEEYKEYIYGSAEVVGLMCLTIFVNGNQSEYERLKPYARHFGSALQKVNFLRDLNADFNQLDRVYFPDVNFDEFTNEEKQKIEQDIQYEFDQGLIGIQQLPKSSRYAVLLAHRYYNRLLDEIRRTDAKQLFQQRIRVSDFQKTLLFARVSLKKKANA